jgi:hypothetical protein
MIGSVWHTAVAASTDAGRFAGFFYNGQCGSNFSSFGRRTTYCSHVAIRHIVFAATALSRALGLPFCLFYDTVRCMLL